MATPFFLQPSVLIYQISAKSFVNSHTKADVSNDRGCGQKGGKGLNRVYLPGVIEMPFVTQTEWWGRKIPDRPEFVEIWQRDPGCQKLQLCYLKHLGEVIMDNTCFFIY